LNNTSEKLIYISTMNFSAKGYYGTSLTNIANNVGIKKRVYIIILKVRTSFMKYV